MACQPASGRPLARGFRVQAGRRARRGCGAGYAPSIEATADVLYRLPDGVTRPLASSCRATSCNDTRVAELDPRPGADD